MSGRFAAAEGKSASAAGEITPSSYRADGSGVQAIFATRDGLRKGTSATFVCCQ
jgi:hypothetical protein